MMLGDWMGMPPAPFHLRVVPLLVIGLVGFVAMAAGSWLGWKLVEIHHVGVDETQPEPGVAEGMPAR